MITFNVTGFLTDFTNGQNQIVMEPARRQRGLNPVNKEMVNTE